MILQAIPAPILYIIIGFFLLVFLTSAIFVVKQQSAYIIERFGKFQSVKYAGLHFRIPIIERIAHKQSLRIHQQDTVVETKTSDDVFVKLKVSVQFVVETEMVYNAFYKLENPIEQIDAYIFDVVRAEVPKQKLDDVFAHKDDLASAIKSELGDAMEEYGHKIIKALVTDIDPDEKVKHAMNRINAAEREKTAASYEAETDRIKIVAKAKAEAESKKLQGQGIADQRMAIARGLKESVEMLDKVGVSAAEASSLIVVTQHYDTLQAIGAQTGSNLILMPNSPGEASNMLTQMTASLRASQMMDNTDKKPKS
jgi:regulator of protease activity HflC (stomatin/prohibitin superfamily)